MVIQAQHSIAHTAHRARHLLGRSHFIRSLSILESSWQSGFHIPVVFNQILRTRTSRPSHAEILHSIRALPCMLASHSKWGYRSTFPFSLPSCLTLYPYALCSPCPCESSPTWWPRRRAQACCCRWLHCPGPCGRLWERDRRQMRCGLLELLWNILVDFLFWIV